MDKYIYGGKGALGLIESYKADAMPFLTTGDLKFGEPCFGNGVIREIVSALFPLYFNRGEDYDFRNPERTKEGLNKIGQRLFLEIGSNVRAYCQENNDSGCSEPEMVEKSRKAVDRLLDSLGEIRELVKLDVEAAAKGDPAAKGYTEIIRSYPGFYAIMVHRIAHVLYEQGVPYYPRALSEEVHSKTGIDIHPGARIGKHFFIDHGTGVVIGETTVIGEWVRIYQGVTLGALSLSQDKVAELKASGRQRHPTIGDRVIIYAGATILGGKTVIGEDSVIGGNVWLTKPLAAGSIVFLEDAPHQKVLSKKRETQQEEND